MVFNEVCSTNEDQQTSGVSMVPNPQVTTPAEPITTATQPSTMMATNIDSGPVDQTADATDKQWDSQPVQY